MAKLMENVIVILIIITLELHIVQVAIILGLKNFVYKI